MRQYYHDTREIRLRKAREYYAAHKEECLKKAKTYYKENKEKVDAQKKERLEKKERIEKQTQDRAKALLFFCFFKAFFLVCRVIFPSFPQSYFSRIMVILAHFFFSPFNVLLV